MYIMEIAIPFLALGGLFIISNQDKDTNEKNTSNTNTKESFNSMGKPANYLPNTRPPPRNYPVINETDVRDTVQEYSNPNAATDKYFNQNAYKERARAGKPIGSNIQDIYSLSGDYMASDEFKHNNMVPFTGSKTKEQIGGGGNPEAILDSYAGNGAQSIKKVEQAPLFKPEDSVQWTHGAPNMSEFYQSRVNPAQRNNMVKPFATERVGPGLNKGPTTDGYSGFNSGMDARDTWMPKTVDELRVSTNPKEEYSLENHQGPAGAVIKNMGQEGRVEKYRPDTFFVNSQERWFTTTGAEKAPRPIGDELVKEQHRNETSSFQQGAASAAIKTASYAPNKYEKSRRIHLDGPQPGPSNGTSTAPHHDDKENNKKSHKNYTNNRSSVANSDVYGGISGAIGAVIAPVMDIMRPSRREEYVNNARIYGDPTNNASRGYVVEKGDVPKYTIKESTLYQPNAYIGNQVLNAGYEVTDQQPITNQRDSTTEYSQFAAAGGAGARYGDVLTDAIQTVNTEKEKTVVGRTNAGNAKMFNSSINASITKDDAERENPRMWVPQNTVQNGPMKETYGHSNLPKYNDTAIGVERINPAMLDAIKSNPYAFPYNSVA